MADVVRWRVTLVRPGEREMALLAELASRRDCQIVAVIDPGGQALGTAIAEVMGLPILPDLAAFASDATGAAGGQKLPD